MCVTSFRKVMTMDLYKGYVPTKNKQCIMTFKGKSSDELMTLDQVKDLPEYAGILNDETILIDVDDSDQAETLMNIVDDLQLDCRVLQTSRGKHFLFRNKGVDQCYTHCKTAIGLTVDIKIGTRNSYEVLKVNGEDRFIEWDYNIGDLPVWLLPVKTDIDLLNMDDGDGRNSALYKYQLILQSAGLSKEECRETSAMINRYIFGNPLSDQELMTVTRDDAYRQHETFFKGRTFFQHAFGKYMINEFNIVKVDEDLCIYKDGVYSNNKGHIYEAMRSVIPSIKKNQKAEVMDYLLDTAPKKEVSDAHLILFQNGILNIDTDDFFQFSPEYVITNKIPWNYNPDAYDANADGVLNRISCDDPDIRSLLEECIGYCFYRENVFHKAFILIGEKSNGKSTFIKVLNRILGDDNVSAIDLKNLGDRFSKATMFGKLANIGDDISDDFIPDASMFKKIASGDRIQVEKKGKDPFEFNPCVKLIFSANSIPRIKDKTGAVIRRLVIVPFNAVFSEDDPDFDPDIKKKLSTQSAMEYFIKVGVEGLKRLLDQKRFTKSSKVQKELDDYEEYNNPVIGFFRDMEEGYLFKEDAKTIYIAYSAWCHDNAYSPESKNQFGRSLKSLYGVESKQKTIGGQSVRMYVKMTQ